MEHNLQRRQSQYRKNESANQSELAQSKGIEKQWGEPNGNCRRNESRQNERRGAPVHGTVAFVTSVRKTNASPIRSSVPSILVVMAT